MYEQNFYSQSGRYDKGDVMGMELRNDQKIIYHLCADIGSDSIYYQKNGYDVRLIGRKIGVENAHPEGKVYGVIANPPCTHFSIARTCAKTPRDLKEGMRLVKECLRFIWECQYMTPLDKRRGCLKFWVIENPATGMLKDFLGKPAYVYSPDEFGADFTKRTALWGMFNPPPKPFMKYISLNKHNSIKDKMSICKYKGTFEEKREQQMHERSMCYEASPKHFMKPIYNPHPPMMRKEQDEAHN